MAEVESNSEFLFAEVDGNGASSNKVISYPWSKGPHSVLFIVPRSLYLMETI